MSEDNITSKKIKIKNKYIELPAWKHLFISEKKKVYLSTDVVRSFCAVRDSTLTEIALNVEIFESEKCDSVAAGQAAGDLGATLL